MSPGSRNPEKKVIWGQEPRHPIEKEKLSIFQEGVMETTELQQAAAQEQAPRRKSGLLFLLLGLIIVLAIGAVAYLNLKGSGGVPQDLATIAPPESIVYVSLDLRPLISQKKQFEPVIKAWEASELVKLARTEMETQLNSEGINLKEDIFSWAGPTLAFALIDFPGMGKSGPGDIPNFLVIGTTRDPQKAKTALAKLSKKAGDAGKMESYQGAELYRLKGGELSYGIDGKLVLLSSKVETLKAAVDRYHGKGKQLAQLEAYRKTTEPLSHSPRERVVSYFANLRALQELMKTIPELSKANISTPGANEIETLGGCLTITPEAIETESFGWGSKFSQSPTYKILSPLPPVGGRAFEFLPKDSVMAAALPSPAAYWKVVQDALAQAFKGRPDDPIGEIKNGLKQATGLDLEQDVLGWMTGEAALGIFGVDFSGLMRGDSEAMPVQMSLVFTGKDEATVASKLALLRKAIENVILKESGTAAAWQPAKTGEVSYYTLPIPGTPISPCLGQVGKLAILSLTAKGFKQTVDAGLDAKQSIITNDTYQKAKGVLPRRPVSIFFMGPTALGEQLSQMAMIPYVAPVSEVLQSSKYIIGGEELLPEGVHSIGRMEIDYAKLIKAMDVLVPVFEQARGKAQNVTCLSNVKQISLGMLMFADDHDEQFPKAEHWVDDLMPYVKDVKLFKCPEDKSGARSSFAMNSALSGKSMAIVMNPASVVMVFETDKPGENPVGGPEAVLKVPRHNGNAYGFADGHAKISGEIPNFDPKQ
jgi:hypothetical protein